MSVKDAAEMSGASCVAGSRSRDSCSGNLATLPGGNFLHCNGEHILPAALWQVHLLASFTYCTAVPGGISSSGKHTIGKSSRELLPQWQAYLFIGDHMSGQQIYLLPHTFSGKHTSNNWLIILKSLLHWQASLLAWQAQFSCRHMQANY